MESKLALAKQNLSPEEYEEYEKYVRAGKPSLSTSTASKLYALYLQGMTCAEIAEANKGFDLGMIVKAKVELDWDKRKLDYQSNLLNSIQTKAKQAQLEAISFAVDGMAVFHKMAGERFKKYIQTGDKEALGDLYPIFTFKTYRNFVELMLQLTGQTGEGGKTPGPIVNVNVGETNSSIEVKEAVKGKGSDILEFLASKAKAEDGEENED